jgi:6-pyruvoyl-tetrahydropterin synthase
MILFVDHLTNVDFSFLHPERGLLGETWLANVRLRGELDEQGMVCDFGKVKKIIRHWLDTELDHRLAVPTRSPNITIKEEKEFLHLRWYFGDDLSIEGSEFIETRAPHDAIALIDAEVLNEKTVADWCVNQLTQLFPDSVTRIELEFVTEKIEGPFYHYSHGLKKHLGNCQRIAHGHRSRIDIWANGDKSPILENHWADLWRDIYIGTREDIIDRPDHEGIGYYRFAYQAQQGPFELLIPQRCCYLIETDSTVEFIAHHIAQQLRQTHPAISIRVKAYEGLSKGAIAEA